MKKEDYIAHRDNLNICFQMYLAIKGYRQPSPRVMQVVQMNISEVKLRDFLDNHFEVNYCLEDQEKNIIKIW